MRKADDFMNCQTRQKKKGPQGSLLIIQAGKRNVEDQERKTQQPFSSPLPLTPIFPGLQALEWVCCTLGLGLLCSWTKPLAASSRKAQVLHLVLVSSGLITRYRKEPSSDLLVASP